MGVCHQPHSTRSCELALRAVGAARGPPGGGASCLGVGRRGLGALQRPTARRWGVRLGPATHWLSVLGVLAWRPVTNPTTRALRAGFARCGGGTRTPGGAGGLLPRCGASRVGRFPTAGRLSSGRAAGACYPLAASAGGVGVGTSQQPQSTHSCELVLRAVGAARGRPGGAPLASVWGVRGWALSHAQPPLLVACGWGLLPTGLRCGWV